ncbi:hypothetical protein JAAARDRAFT_323590 [Jaapia argillacea MUCL 33604]|uniref:F-box domain-containing protein n=1 Tax=Jaapia argillacea MUCL 33604 TaxID=933084 RepID=A0A067PL90_9AGAM|nr:hypothetical protein JAAARDRAFT_323590 [Jaapia argillacea MUCL 33604]
MSDIKNLPNELLEYIFRYAATGVRPVGENQELPFSISASHVCRHWRELSLNTPGLWSRLNISILRSWEEERVRVCLERSRKALLDIRLSRHDWADGSSQQDEASCSMKMPAFISLLLPHIHRWRTLAINIDPDRVDVDGPYIAVLKQLSDHSAPKLEYLHVSVIEPSRLRFGQFTPQPIEPILVQGASALTRVRLRNVLAGEGCLPFQNVTTLDLGVSDKSTSPAEYDDIKWVLGSSPHLEDLTLRGKLFTPDYNTSVIELPFLRSLKVVLVPFWDPRYTGDLFTALSTPALRTLELYALSEDVLDGFIGAMTDSLPQPKYPILETFGLASMDGPSEISDELFAGMPDVRHLRLLDAASVDDLFGHLARNVAGRKPVGWLPLWPNLSTITFLDYYGPSDFKPLGNFLRRRSQLNRGISTIRADSSPFHGLGWKSLRALRKVVEVEELDLEGERRKVATMQEIDPDCWYE